MKKKLHELEFLILLLILKIMNTIEINQDRGKLKKIILL
jgi:hypothetical protein